MTKIKIEIFREQGGLLTVRDGKPDDLFIVCASYEPRTIAIAESLAPEYRTKKGIIYVNKEFLEGQEGNITNSNIERLREILKKHSDKVDVVEGSWLDAKVQLYSLREALKGNDEELSEATITLDITTFNREALLTLMALLRAYYPKTELRILYVSPASQDDWLSRGFRMIRNVMGFPGIQRSSRPTVLILLSGFEQERASKIIDELEPTIVWLGVGIPPTDPKHLERNLKEQKLILSRQEVQKFCFPADNIMGCCKGLENIAKKYLKNYNIVLAPMSTKLSTIAAFLTAEKYTEIQITYCIPGEYNLSNYTRGEDTIFIDTIPYNT